MCSVHGTAHGCPAWLVPALQLSQVPGCHEHVTAPLRPRAAARLETCLPIGWQPLICWPLLLRCPAGSSALRSPSPSCSSTAGCVVQEELVTGLTQQHYSCGEGEEGKMRYVQSNAQRSLMMLHALAAALLACGCRCYQPCAACRRSLGISLCLRHTQLPRPAGFGSMHQTSQPKCLQPISSG